MASAKNRDVLVPSDIVIPKDKAVFWLDTNGCWRNESGRFRHKKISAHFHAAIRKDAGGFFLYQDRGEYTEKVYFPFEDTALFVFGVALDDDVSLTLNTGETILLEPQKLFVQNDHLYITREEDRVKFSERSLLKISTLLDVDDDVYFIHLNGQKYRIASRSSEE
jgi:hypothetical protein